MDTKQLTGIPETMLTTLWAKATETKRPDALLRDIYATEIIKHVDYDFSKFKKGKFSQAGVCVRAKLIDDEVITFLKEYPDGVVIQLGAGLDARYQRLDCPHCAHWYDLDLEKVIDIRRRFIPETETNTFLSMSMFDYKWIEEVKKYNTPVLIILEGVLMYFKEEQVKAFINELCSRLDKATILMDILCYVLVGKAKHHDVISKMDDNTEFLWSILHTKDMEKWNNRLHLIREYFMSDYDHGRFPLIFRLLYKIPYCYIRCNQRIVRLDIY